MQHVHCTAVTETEIALQTERYESEFMRGLKELVKNYEVFCCILKCYSFLRELLDSNKTLR